MNRMRRVCGDYREAVHRPHGRRWPLAALTVAVVLGVLTLSTASAFGQETAEDQSPAMLDDFGSATQLAGLTIGDVCTVKGQEGNTLSGFGLVVGLNGTGDGKFSPMLYATMRYLQKMRVPISDARGAAAGSGVAGFDPKNVALVSVMAEVDGQGARQGSQIDCHVSALNAKSLKGGTLLVTPLIGPVPPTDEGPEPPVYALAQGVLRLDDSSNLTNARITRGCRLERNINNLFVKDNKITLVIRAPHARFSVAQEIESAINDNKKLAGPDGMPIAHAVDQVTVEVQILQQYRSNPVQFAALVLQQDLQELPNVASVVINETAGVIAISGDLKISPEAIQHKNMQVFVGDSGAVSQFMELDVEADSSVPTLKALVQSLNALRVATPDMIEIIRTLDEKGAIQGHVIYK